MTSTMRRVAVVLAVALGAAVPVTTAHAQTGCNAPTLSVSGTAPYEGDVDVTATIRLTVKAAAQNPCAVDGSVSYSTASGSAVDTSDFESTQGTLDWTPSSPAEQNIDVTIRGDVLKEPDETFTLNVRPRGFSLANTAIEVWLLDDDGWAVTEPMRVGVNGGKICWVPDICAVPLTVSTPPRASFTVRYRTYDVTAVAGLDYVGVKEAQVTVPRGATKVYAPVTLLPDKEAEPDETFALEIFGTTAGSISNPVEKVTIRSAR